MTKSKDINYLIVITALFLSLAAILNTFVISSVNLQLNDLFLRISTLESGELGLGTGFLVSPNIDDVQNPNNVNILNFGARGNDQRDDTLQIQRALDYLKAERGGTLVIPCGTYYIGKALKYYSDITIVGSGKCSVLKNMPNRAAPYIMLEPSKTQISNFKLFNVVIDQSFGTLPWRKDSYAVNLNGVSDTIISGVIFRNIITMAIHIHTSQLIENKNVYLISNLIEQSEGAGISVFGHIRNIQIISNIIRRTKDDAIAIQAIIDNSNPGGWVSYPSSFVIERNTITDSYQRNSFGSTPHGILIWGGFNGRIINNRITHSGADGILISSGGSDLRPHNIIIVNNVLERVGDVASGPTVAQNGIAVMNSYDIHIINNLIRYSYQSGIRIVNSNNLNLANNKILFSRASGVELDGVTDSVVTGNNILDNGLKSLNLQPWGITLISNSLVTRSLLISQNSIGNSGLRTPFDTTYAIYSVSGAAGSTDYIALDDNIFSASQGILGGMSISQVNWL